MYNGGAAAATAGAERIWERVYRRSAEHSREHYFSMYKRERKEKKRKTESATKKLGANILIVCLPASADCERSLPLALCVCVYTAGAGFEDGTLHAGGAKEKGALPCPGFDPRRCHGDRRRYASAHAIS